MDGTMVIIDFLLYHLKCLQHACMTSVIENKKFSYKNVYLNIIRVGNVVEFFRL